MKVEAFAGDGRYHSFITATTSNYCPEGPHKIKLPLPESEYVLTIDNGSNSLGLCIADVKTKAIYFAANFMRSVEKNSADFISEFTVTLKYFFQTIDKIAYVKIEEPYNRRDPRFANSYATLKLCYNTVKHICKTNDTIFIPTLPAVWQPQFIGEEKKYSSSVNKTIIKSKVKLLYPMINLKNQDVYDAIGMKEAFFKDDIQDGCFIRVNTSTQAKIQMNKEATVKVYDVKKVNSEILKDDLYPFHKKMNFEPKVSAFGYNNKFSLIENIRTGLFYRKNDLLVTLVSVDLKLLPVLYAIPNDLKNIREGSQVIIAGRIGGEFTGYASEGTLTITV